MALKIISDNGNLKSLKSLSQECLKNYSLDTKKAVEKSAKKDFTILFSTEGGKKTGFITGYGEGTKMHIWLLGVKKGNRGKGIGSALISEFSRSASEKGYKAIHTITFNKYREKLMLSLRLGFQITGFTYIKEKNDNAIELEKPLV